MLRHALILFAMSTVALAAVAESAVDEIPDEPKDGDGCWLPTIQQSIPVGEIVPSTTTCEGYRCLGTKAVVESCAAVRAVPPSYVVSDNTVPYPDCCPTIVNPTL